MGIVVVDDAERVQEIFLVRSIFFDVGGYVVFV